MAPIIVLLNLDLFLINYNLVTRIATIKRIPDFKIIRSFIYSPQFEYNSNSAYTIK